MFKILRRCPLLQHINVVNPLREMSQVLTLKVADSYLECRSFRFGELILIDEVTRAFLVLIATSQFTVC